MRFMSAPVVLAKVSNRGQTSLPAELRHRWGIETGGDVAFVDLGDAALILPCGMDLAKGELRRVLSERYEAGLAAITDADLADQ
jgi:bifunctional DNA-binding transcriptional regulator/antitoxin component of YhaV-PrlF toxin-antitoxin module